MVAEVQTNRISLPVDRILPELTAAIQNGCRQMIVRATPGSGKTTRIPAALLATLPGQIWVLEPRRLAAKMSAVRVASELNDTTSAVVGWQMRDDTFVKSSTRLLFLTEGMFPVLLAENQSLAGVSCVVIDEFHERHVQTDVALALTLHLQRTSRPDIVLIVMSATLDIQKLQGLLPTANVIDVTAPVFPVETVWWRGDPRLALVDKVSDGIRAVMSYPTRPTEGHILVFLPGSRDIERSAEVLRRSNFSNTGDWEVLELRASLPRAVQERIFVDTGKRKVILATNIAESSITIPGVTAVIDSGLARVPTYDPWNQMPTLETRPVSQASLIQRAGRAGRTAPGLVLRLFGEQDYAGRPASDQPEILRTDLSSLLMTLQGIAARLRLELRPEDLPWLDAPVAAAWKQARDLLESLGITQPDGKLLKPKIAVWPLHPRIARFLDACCELDLATEGAWLASILADEQKSIETPPGSDAYACDLLARYDAAVRTPDHPRFHNVARLARQLQKLARSPQRSLKPADQLDIEGALLVAYGDRVARARRPFQNKTPRDYTLCTGGDATLITESAASHSDWVIAWAIGSTRSTGSAQTSVSGRPGTGAVMIEGASAVSPELLTKLDLPLARTSLEVLWDDVQERVRSVEQVNYGCLTINERRTAHEPGATSDLLAKKLGERWPKPFPDDDILVGFIRRQKLLKEHDLASHVWDFEELKSLLISMMTDGAASFSDVAAQSLSAWLRLGIGESEWLEVERFAPTEIKVGAGFFVPVNYEADHQPWVAARLQNFFGQMQTPKILQGRVPLTLHLLAPNQRALQVTTDLASFWQNTYPTLRNEYMRKYPRHYWPENPAEAEPPVRGSLKTKR